MWSPRLPAPPCSGVAAAFFALEQQFSVRGDFVPQGHLAMFGYILVVPLWSRLSTTGIYRIEDRVDVKYPMSEIWFRYQDW